MKKDSWFLDSCLEYLTPAVLPEVEDIVIVRGLDRPRRFSELDSSRQSGCSLVQDHGRDSSIKLNGRYL